MENPARRKKRYERMLGVKDAKPGDLMRAAQERRKEASEQEQKREAIKKILGKLPLDRVAALT